MTRGQHKQICSLVVAQQLFAPLPPDEMYSFIQIAFIHTCLQILPFHPVSYNRELPGQITQLTQGFHE